MNREQFKQRIDRLVHSKKEYDKSARKTATFKREYIKSALVLLYGRNDETRNSLLPAEIHELKKLIRDAKAVFHVKRSFTHLPRNMRNEITARMV
jgi:hypothetical protein